MAEVEIHTEHEHASDPFGQGVGIMVGVIGILLAVVTIMSHREHTNAVVHKTEANDQWAFYEAKKGRADNEQIGADLLSALAADPTKVASLTAKYSQASAKHSTDAQAIMAEANARESEAKESEKRAVRFDLGEGFLELGLVMSSLYFLSHRREFVVLGGTAAIIGTVVGVLGLLA